MDALTSLKKGKDAVFDFVGRTSRSVFRFAVAAIPYLYLNVLLLGLSSHPRIACRSFDLVDPLGDRYCHANRSWDKFVKFILKDCKVFGAFCSCLIMSLTLISAATYHSDPITCQLNFVAVLPPAFGIAQVSCIVWHLKSTAKYPGAPIYWQKVTIYNERSSFIRTASLLAAPAAWTLWSAVSFIMILFVVLFRGLPISALNASQVSASSNNWIVEAFNLVFTYGVDGSAEALMHLSVASRACAAVILTIGCIHLAITVFFFTRLCLPQEVPSTQDVLKISSSDSPLHYCSCPSPYFPPHSPSYSSSFSTPPSPSETSNITTSGPSPTEPVSPPKLAISTNASYPASSTPSPSPGSGLFVSALAEYFPSPTTTLYAPSPIMSSPQAGKSPPEHRTPPLLSADTTQPPPKAVLRGTPVEMRPQSVPF